MSPQERELIATFLHQLTQAQTGPKDNEADALIRDACARQPEAAYLLVQRAIGLDVALQAAQAQVAKLQAELNQLQQSGSSGFLSGPHTWGASAPKPSTGPLAVTTASAVSQNYPAMQAPMVAARPASAWGASMLGTVATTAAGVVAGSFLYQGIQGMMGHHDTGSNASAHSVAPPTHDLASSTVASEEFTGFDDAGDSDEVGSDAA